MADSKTRWPWHTNVAISPVSLKSSYGIFDFMGATTRPKGAVVLHDTGSAKDTTALKTASRGTLQGFQIWVMIVLSISGRDW